MIQKLKDDRINKMLKTMDHLPMIPTEKSDSHDP